ncbi:MAG: hypothetical protein V4690_01820 [Patescibacteria group bacterium]
MNKKIIVALGVVLLVGLTFAVMNYPYSERSQTVIFKSDSENTKGEPEVYECNGDGKVCWDGSLVGRTGPNCEFSACPLESATSAEVLTYMGGTMTALNISVTAKQLVSDSRCPTDVVCIWAGTVEVRTVISSKTGHGEHTLKLGVPQRFGEFQVTLVEVTPEAKSTEKIPESSYRFKYKIERI